MLRLEIRFHFAREGLAGQHFDGREHVHLIGTHQGNRLTGVARTPSTADTVDVVFGHDRQVKVDHQRQVFDIQATGRYVGSHQDLHVAGLEAVQCALAGGLGFVAMDAVGVDAQALQLVHQGVHAVAGLGEHQHLLPTALAHQVHKQLRLALFIHRHHPLLDGVGGDVARADFDAQRVVEHLPGEQANVIGEGRGEQQGLALFRQHAVDIRQFFGEAQVEHAVSFIQHQGLQLVELQRVLAEQVDQAARGGDQNVHTLAQLHHLRVDAHAAVHRVSGQRQVLGVLGNAGVDLLGQFASGAQDQRTR